MKIYKSENFGASLFNICTLCCTGALGVRVKRRMIEKIDIFDETDERGKFLMVEIDRVVWVDVHMDF